VAATLTDILALQKATVSDSTNLSAAVAQCAALSAADHAAWYDLAARALAFVSWTPTGGSGLSYDQVWAEGLAIRHAMAAWPVKIRAAGCPDVQNLKQVPATPPTPGPGLGELVWGKLEPALVLVVLAVVVWGRNSK
jgi:hypothetical protein